MAVVTQLYYQVYITYHLHVSANAAVAIFSLDIILSEKLYRYDITQPNGITADGRECHIA